MKTKNKYTVTCVKSQRDERFFQFFQAVYMSVTCQSGALEKREKVSRGWAFFFLAKNEQIVQNIAANKHYACWECLKDD